jgi:hypothetical protein
LEFILYLHFNSECTHNISDTNGCPDRPRACEDRTDVSGIGEPYEDWARSPHPPSLAAKVEIDVP